jgi:hypothetical protein
VNLMSMHTLGHRLQRELDNLIEGRKLNAGDVTLYYTEAVATNPGFDPNVEGTYPSRPEKQCTFGALVHIVSVRTTQRQFAEIQTGDAIITFRENVSFEGKENIRFEFGGEKWVQQAVGKDLASYWENYIGGRPIGKTIVLRQTT